MGTVSNRLPVSDRHALYIGWVLGSAMRQGVSALLVDDDDGNHTDQLRIPIGDQYVTLIVPPPPDDWTMS